MGPNTAGPVCTPTPICIGARPAAFLSAFMSSTRWIISRPARIAHEGLAFVDLPVDPQFDDLLHKLEAVATVSLRVLARQAPGTELDQWVRQ